MITMTALKYFQAGKRELEMVTSKGGGVVKRGCVLETTIKRRVSLFTYGKVFFTYGWSLLLMVNGFGLFYLWWKIG